MRIAHFSDLHLEVHPYQIPETDADVIILAGDIHNGTGGVDFAKTLDKPVLYVLGNHEYYQSYFDPTDPVFATWPNLPDRLKKLAEGSNVTILENDVHIINDTRFLGCTLWTDMNVFRNMPLASLEAKARMNDYRLIYKDEGRVLNPEDTLKVHHRSLNWLKSELKKPWKGKTVVITHHSPTMQSVQDIYKRDPLTPAFTNELTPLILNSKIDIWIHGHLHHVVDYQVGDTRVMSNPKGYGGALPAFNANLCVQV